MTNYPTEVCNIESCDEVAAGRLAEQRLIDRERHYHDIFQNLSDAIYLVEVTGDNNFRYLETNRAFEAMMGVAEDGMIGKAVGEVLRSSGAEASAENAVAKFRRCLELGSIISGEFTLDTPSGQRILHSTLTPLFDDAGRINRILGVSRDVTESNRAERLKDFLGYALDQANDAVFLIDPADGHRFRYVNDQACRSLGYSREELLSMSVLDIDPALDTEAAGRVDEQIREQAYIRFETFHRRKDGAVFPVEISGSVIAYGGQTLSLAIVRDISERKRNEQAIAEREREYRNLAENSPDSIIRYDRDGRIRYLNARLLGYLGVYAEDVIGKRPSEAWQDGRYAELERACAHVLATGESTTVEFSEADAAGVLHFNQINIVPERDAGGRIVGTLAVGRDVTAIHEAERKLRHFIANLPGMAYSFRLSPDGHGCMPFASPAIEQYYGLRAEDVKDDIAPIHNLVHPDDLPRTEAAIAESARTMMPFRAEYRVCRPGVPVRWLEARSVPEREADGSILWHGIVLDITSRKAAEAALRASEERMRLFFERQLVGMAITSPEKGWLQANDKICEMFGYSREELSRMTWAELTHPDDLPEDVAQFERMLKGEIDSYAMEKRYLHKDGRIVFVDLSVGCVRREGGAVDYVLSLLADITERKRSEFDRKLLTDILEESPDYVGTGDMQGQLGYHNPAARRMIGLPDDADVSKLRIADMHPEWVTKLIMETALPLVLEQGVWRGETALLHRDGREIPVQQTIMLHRDANGKPIGTSTIMQDITKRKHMEAEARNHLHFFESMDRVNRAIQGSNDLEMVLNQVLETVLAIFDCDRVFLCHPCDPNADSWNVPFEKTKPEFPGALALGRALPMDTEMAKTFRLLLDANDPVTQGEGNQHPLPKEISEQFGIKSHMAVAVYPKGNKPWRFGMHQCSRPRAWTADEQKLFQEIGRRLADALTSLQAYRETQEREQKFQALADSMPDIVAAYDHELRTTYANRNLEQYLAIDIDGAWLGKTPNEHYPDGELDEYQARLEELRDAGSCDDFLWEKSFKGGGTFAYQTRFAALRDPDGKIIGELAVTRDVTKSRQLEQELMRNERELRLLLANTPGYIARFDLELRRTFVSRAYEGTAKTIASEVVGKTPLEYWRLASPTAEEFCEVLRRVVKSKDTERLECNAITAAGTRRYFSMDLAPEFDEDGTVTAVLSVGVETTELKLAEQRRIEAREDERKMLARELHDDLGQRLTTMRLDIALLELRFGKNNPELLAKIKDMDTAAGETIKIVRSLLNMLRPAVLDLGLNTALEWLASEFRKRTQIECNLQLPKQPPVLSEAQSIAIFRIVQESLTNVIKYARARKVSIALTQQGGCHLLEIQDDGQGFELGSTNKTGSFGLKGIEERVQMLGGKLTIVSAPGRGVRLVVQLPR